MLSDGARFIAVFFIAIVIVVTLVVAALGTTIALQGCAICDNDPPSYFAASAIVAVAIGLLWFLMRVIKRLLADQSYRDSEGSR
jgi:hypothetical protein